MAGNAVIESFKYPVLTFSGTLAIPVKSADRLTRCTKHALKNGHFAGLVIADSVGKAVRVRNVRKLHGIGRFGGYNIFLGQSIRIELDLDGEPFKMSLDEVKSRLMADFYSDEGLWDACDDFDELVSFVRDANEIDEITEFMTERFYRVYRTA
jgi:hypothetical protein